MTFTIALTKCRLQFILYRKLLITNHRNSKQNANMLFDHFILYRKVSPFHLWP